MGGEETYSGFEGNELEDHLHSENPGEDHVEDVHGIVKQMRLTVVLQKRRPHRRIRDIKQHHMDFI